MGFCVTPNAEHTLSGPSLSREKRTLGALDFQLYNYSQVERTAGSWGRREATQAVTQFVKSNLSRRQGPAISSAGLGEHREATCSWARASDAFPYGSGSPTLGEGLVLGEGTAGTRFCLQDPHSLTFPNTGQA